MRPTRLLSPFILLAFLFQPLVLQAAPPSHQLAEAVVAPPAMAPARGLADLLDDEGRLTLPEGFNGSIDPTGFDLRLGKDGAPRFLAKRGAIDADMRWRDGFSQNGCNGPIAAIAVGPVGELYLGGDFLSCGGVAANHVIRFDPDSGVWSALGSGGGQGVSHAVTALAVLGNEVYVGGLFTQANVGAAIEANHIARWDGTGWSPLGQIEGSGTNDGVLALAVRGSDLYVGGSFTQVNVGAVALAANRVARWNGTAWSVLGSGLANGVDSRVDAFAVNGDDLYVGGLFTRANFADVEEPGPGVSIPANAIARWDGTTWSPLGSGGGNGLNGAVSALALLEGTLFVGGTFTQANLGADVSANRIARWNGSAWSDVGSEGGNGLNSPVTALAVLGSNLYAGGLFNQANEGEAAISASYLARWNGTTWSAVGGGVDFWVFALAAAGDDLYVGGFFSGQIVRWDGSTMSTLSGGDGMDGPVTAMAALDGNLYVGGEFGFSGGVAAHHIARWDGLAWSALGSDGGNGVGGGVYALAVLGNDLYAGGDFTEVNVGAPIAANRIARWDGLAWSAVGGGGGNGVDGGVYALAVLGNDLYVGGDFIEANVGEPVTVNRVARWSGTHWSGLGSGVGVGMNDGVFALAALGNDLYAGGEFTESNLGESIVTNHVARWDGSTWTALGSGGGIGVSGGVSAIAVQGSALFVGGAFNEANVGASIPANNVARWSGTEWSVIGSSGGNGVDGMVFALAVLGGDLYVGGSFGEANAGASIMADNIARWDGSAWTALGSGTDDTVNALAITNGQKPNAELYVGGVFQFAGAKPSNNIGRYDATLAIFADGFEAVE
jgi:trimeric autotransporter adhesin